MERKFYSRGCAAAGSIGVGLAGGGKGGRWARCLREVRVCGRVRFPLNPLDLVDASAARPQKCQVCPRFKTRITFQVSARPINHSGTGSTGMVNRLPYQVQPSLSVLSTLVYASSALFGHVTRAAEPQGAHPIRPPGNNTQQARRFPTPCSPCPPPRAPRSARPLPPPPHPPAVPLTPPPPPPPPRPSPCASSHAPATSPGPQPATATTPPPLLPSTSPSLHRPRPPSTAPCSPRRRVTHSSCRHVHRMPFTQAGFQRDSCEGSLHACERNMCACV
jgi:hypothetical protein